MGIEQCTFNLGRMQAPLLAKLLHGWAQMRACWMQACWPADAGACRGRQQPTVGGNADRPRSFRPLTT